MFLTVLPSLLLAFMAAAAVAGRINELVLQPQEEVGEVVLTPRPMFRESELPQNFDYRSTGLLTTDLNQHIPVYCGSCWAHAALSSIADRIKIMTNGTMRDVIPSVQAMINCGDAGSCNGGDSNAANRFVYYQGIPDSSCQQYQAINMECSAINTCMNCDPGSGSCYAVEDYPKITLSEYGRAEGELAIMSEIYARGPVSAYINADCIEEYTGGISMYDTCERFLFNHAIQLNGWGVDEETGTKYWIGRNSWGTYWGERGFFRIVRGGSYVPGIGFWAVPKIPDF